LIHYIGIGFTNEENPARGVVVQCCVVTYISGRRDGNYHSSNRLPKGRRQAIGLNATDGITDGQLV